MIAACTEFESRLPNTPNKPNIQVDGEKYSKSNPGANAIKLTGAEILQAFSNVRDDAEVRDSPGNTAVNYWLADGRFFNRWSDGKGGGGEVTGTWRVKNSLRCVTILSGLPQRLNQEKCGPIFRRAGLYLSMNENGTVHGAHTLSPLSPSQVLQYRQKPGPGG